MTLSAASADQARLAMRIREMLTAGRPAAAAPMLRVLRGLHAPADLLAELDARMLMAAGHVQEAANELAGSIASMPGHAALHACRAEALMRLDQPDAALPDAAEAVLLAPKAAEAKALLGIVLVEAGRPEEAGRCLAEALQADPAVSSYRIGLAEALHRLGRPNDAIFVLRDGIRLAPRDLAVRRAAILHAVRAGFHEDAVELGEAAREAGVLDAAVFGLTGHALGALGRHHEAFHAYGEASRLDPDDAYVRHLAAAGGAVPAGPRAPDEYVRVVFDGYAARVAPHRRGLRYRGPGLIRAALEALPELSGPVTDLGCGTGLLAVTCSDLAGPWTGVDLSRAMLAQARARGLYEDLVEGEITAVPEALPPAGLVLAGDVLCYFGALDGVLEVMRHHLQPGGHAVFSLETGNEPFTIGANGRFSHGEAYVRAAAEDAGFSVLALQHDILRLEHDRPVPGLIVTVRAPR